jgi:hypothetical protein
MNINHDLEQFARTVNDMDAQLPNSRSRCFDIGTWGGCGVDCAAFCDGECGEPQEIRRDEIIDEHGLKDALEIMSQYDCFVAQGS